MKEIEMASAFSSKKGGVEPSAKQGRDPKDQGGEPTTGFVQSPKSDCHKGAPGPGVGNSRGGIR